MRRLEVLQLLAGALFGLAIWSRLSEWRTVARLTHAGATSATKALPVSADTPVAWFRLNRLLRAGVIVEAGKGRYYLDPEAYRRFREQRRKRTITVMVLVLLVIVLLSRTLPR